MDMGYNAVINLADNKIYVTFNKEPFEGMTVEVNGFLAYQNNSAWTIFTVTFTSPTTITFTVSGPNSKCNVTYNPEELKLTFSSYDDFGLRENEGNVHCKFITDAGPSLRLSDNNNSYKVYLKERIDDKLAEITSLLKSLEARIAQLENP